MATKLPAVLDQGLIDPDNYESSLLAIRVRQLCSLLSGVTLPCGYPGCSVCDPEADHFYCEGE